MDAIAVKVVDPSDQHWAQLLEPFVPLRQLVPPLVQRLELPERLRYELVRQVTGHALGEGQTLAEAGVTAGESLLLRPVRGPFLDAFVDALYEEAASFAAEQVWDEAQNRLETLARIKPDHPDSKGLWRKVATRGGAPSPPSSRPPSPPKGSTGGGAATGASIPKPSLPTAKATGGSSFGCLILVVGGVFVLLWGLGGPLGLPLPEWFPKRGETPSASIPSTPSPTTPEREGEPVLGTGDVQVTLRWDNAADLDLHVTDPAGDIVSFTNRSVTSGGQLDVDAHAGCSDQPPVENVFWPTSGAPSGAYSARVHYYGACGAGAATYELTVRVDGQIVEQRSGTLNAEGEEATFAFNR